MISSLRPQLVYRFAALLLLDRQMQTKLNKAIIILVPDMGGY